MLRSGLSPDVSHAAAFKHKQWGVPLVGVVLMALLVAGCGLHRDADAGQSNAEQTTVGAGSKEALDPLEGVRQPLRRFYGQNLRWETCALSHPEDFDMSGFQCARLQVPVDYDTPEGETVHLMVVKDPADNQQDRQGSLVYNPGGPGESAVNFLPRMKTVSVIDQVSHQFDVVGFDPRGVAHSAPLTCFEGEQLDDYLASDPIPDNDEQMRQSQALSKRFAQECQRNTGDLLGHVSSMETARDMDVLRAALGDSVLNYVGFSYGTYMGALYAQRFPTRVGRMVLDGAIDPSLDAWGFSLGQAKGFEMALGEFVADCLAHGSQCPLTGSVQEGKKQIRVMVDKADKQPYPTGTTRLLTQNLAFIGVASHMYSRQSWPLLRSALSQVLTQGTAGLLLEAADSYYARGPQGFNDNSVAAMAAVSCLDRSAVATAEQVRQRLPQFEQASPTFGHYLAWSNAACQTWPYPASVTPGAVRAAGAPPIVVLGTTGDPATPYEWAQALADQLDSGHLVTRVGQGHLALGAGSSCIDSQVGAFLLRGVLPSQNQCES